MSVNFIKMDDHTFDGKTDMRSYNAAQLANGDRCSECGVYIMFPKGHRDKCRSCEKARTDDGELTHTEKIRCPKCRHMMNSEDVAECTDYRLYNGNEDTKVTCLECDHEFEVVTHISYSFVSPAMGEIEVG